jgi:hypothetical protein
MSAAPAIKLHAMNLDHFVESEEVRRRVHSRAFGSRPRDLRGKLAKRVSVLIEHRCVRLGKALRPRLRLRLTGRTLLVSLAGRARRGLEQRNCRHGCHASQYMRRGRFGNLGRPSTPSFPLVASSAHSPASRRLGTGGAWPTAEP